jgi:hypothetical protein
LPIEYSVAVKDLTSLNGNHLDEWRKHWPAERANAVHALDLLYAIAPEKS